MKIGEKYSYTLLKIGLKNMNSTLTAIIGERDKGKTTYLWNQYVYAKNAGKRILVIDSATEHVEKSLLMKIKSTDSDSVLIPQCDEKKIVFPYVNQYSYPFGKILEGEKLYLCDSSYYLEKGYDYPEGRQREACRKLYKYYSIQVAMLLMNDIDVFLFDEIELLSEFRNVICNIQNKHKDLFIALHKLAGLAGMDELFKIERV